MAKTAILNRTDSTVTREQHELDVLRERACPDLDPKKQKRKIQRAINAWAYQRLLADRCVPLRKVA